jgi:alanine racemase
VSRPTHVYIDATALLHNLNRIKQLAPSKKIIAMVKANAYGCGVSSVIPILDGNIDAYGVACIEEAMNIRNLGSLTDCVLFQGVFSKDELPLAASQNFQCVVHKEEQLDWLLTTPLTTKIKVWIKVNTGMHRLGFERKVVPRVINDLRNCPWVSDEIVLMTHLASADEPNNPYNKLQLDNFRRIKSPNKDISFSIANSAAIIELPATHADYIRPGIMLYGVSPFADRIGRDLGLLPVMRLSSIVSTIHHYPPFSPIGYNSTWQSDKPTKIGVVPIGYGDGYPRHISANTPVWINGYKAPIVGRVSMDMLTIDLSDCPDTKEGDIVELWGNNIPVETIAKSAGTSAYELISQLSPRVRGYR